MHAKEKHLHRLYGKEEIARDGASIYCFIILEVWQRSINIGLEGSSPSTSALMSNF